MITGASQEASQLRNIWSLLLVMPPFLLVALPKSAQTIAARRLSWFLLSAASAMLFRLDFSQVGTAKTVVALLATAVGMCRVGTE